MGVFYPFSVRLNEKNGAGERFLATIIGKSYVKHTYIFHLRRKNFMKLGKKLLSCILAVLMIMSSVTVSFTVFAAAGTSDVLNVIDQY